MKDKTTIEHAIRDVESRISGLQNGLKDWDSLSVNRSGASVYREKGEENRSTSTGRRIAC
jgi:hypothetical protein